MRLQTFHCPLKNDLVQLMQLPLLGQFSGLGNSGVKECLVWAVSCSVSWCTCYIFSQIQTQSTGCKQGVFFGTRMTVSKASYSSCWLYHLLTLIPPPMWVSCSSGIALTFFMAHLLSLGKKHRAQKWLVWMVQFRFDSWSDVWKVSAIFNLGYIILLLGHYVYYRWPLFFFFKWRLTATCYMIHKHHINYCTTARTYLSVLLCNFFQLN